ncbi:MAG: FecR domain-containing protein [Deltaproteobacteria bacterium]|nr:FecR domain-containing protein [Deltaproteobacteria bacterium]
MKQERPKIPVEPLGEARWAKIDDAVFRALDADAELPRATSNGPRPTRKATYVLVAAAIAAAAVLVLLVGRPFGGGASAVLNPSHIETGASASRLAIGESTVEVGPSSAVVASGDDTAGVLLVVERGRVDCEVTPRRSRPPFVVQAGNVRVRVVGTRFTVAREGADVRVAVVHGAVEVSRGADVTVLRDGTSWSSAETAPAVSGAASAPPSASTVAVEVAPPSSSLAPSSASAPVPAPPKASAAPSPSTDPQKIFESAAQREASDPDGAITAYRKVAAGGGAWAPPALFAAGRLAADRGRAGEAKALLEEYLRRYPSGANAEDARRMLARLR